MLGFATRFLDSDGRIWFSTTASTTAPAITQLVTIRTECTTTNLSVYSKSSNILCGCYKRALFVAAHGKWYDPVQPRDTLIKYTKFRSASQHLDNLSHRNCPGYRSRWPPCNIIRVVSITPLSILLASLLLWWCIQENPPRPFEISTQICHDA